MLRCLATGETEQYVYIQEEPGLSNSEITALTDTTFLVLERDGDFPLDPNEPSQIKSIFRIDISGATDVSDPSDGENGLLVDGQTLEELGTPETLEAVGIVPVSKEPVPVADLLDLPVPYPHDKPEGVVVIDGNTIAVVNDDDFGVTDDDGTLIQKILPGTGGAIDNNAIFFIELDTPLF